MGQESSSLLDEGTPPITLSERTVSAVAHLINDGRVRRVVVMTGAGLSTAAGIPDFRSPNTGLYANLARLNLPYAEAVFDISYFRQNPDPFYVLAKELYPGNFLPTISHVFISLLAQKGLLKMLFTQNIDCLEREAGVPGELIVEAHGSFATQRCIECKTPFPDDLMKERVFKGDVPRCLDKKCDGLVKPDIVFFGEQLPEAFYKNRQVPEMSDLVFIMGTSLTVQPFASLPEMVQEGTPRVLFNMERVGSLGTRADDVLVLGDCDSGIRKLADELGWREELEAQWRQVVGEKEAERQLRSSEEREVALQGEVEGLADRVKEGLSLDDDPDGRDGANSDGEERGALETSEELRGLGSEFEFVDDEPDESVKAAPGTHQVTRDSKPEPKDDHQAFEAKDTVQAEIVAKEPTESVQETHADLNKDATVEHQNTKEQTSEPSHEATGKSVL